jgi:hypothetical protein
MFAFTRDSIEALALEGIQVLLPLHPFEVFTFHSLPFTYTHTHPLPLHVLSIKPLEVLPLHPLTFKVLSLAFAFHHQPVPFVHNRRCYSRVRLRMHLRMRYLRTA